MNRMWFSILIYGIALISVAQESSVPAQTVTHVATAVNHLTVIEFHEPVTMVAAGSPDFQIERQENKVFVKPLKSGAASDLFVWTQSRRFAYELETTEEVKNMSFAIDSLAPPPPASPLASTPTDELADMMLTRVFLGAEAITGTGRIEKNKISVRVSEVFRTRTSVYIHYVIENRTKQSWHIPSPSAFAREPLAADPAIPVLMRHQLDERQAKSLGKTEDTSLPVAKADVERQDLRPGESTQGVIVIREDLASPVVVEIVLDAHTKATVVL